MNRLFKDRKNIMKHQRKKNDHKECAINSDNVEGSPIELLPLEILYIIIDKLDAYTFVNCLCVSENFKNITLGLADADKTNIRWKSIFDSYHLETYKDKSCGLSYRELFVNSLRWNLDLSISNFGSCLAKQIQKIKIYKDNIIVIDSEGVTYYDVHTHNIRKKISISQLHKCEDFNENDAFVLRATLSGSTDFKGYRLVLYGKSNPNDEDWFIQRVMYFSPDFINNRIIITVDNVDNYVVEDNICYLIQYHTRAMLFTIWKNDTWVVCNMGRYYGNTQDIICAMNVLHTEVYLQIKWGQMLRYSYKKRNFQNVAYVHMPQNKNNIIKMVHKYCLVIGVTGDRDFIVTRMRNNKNHTFYKLECPNLTCVTQHGEMLLLGYSDGIIQIFMPKAEARENMLKNRIQISDYVTGPFEPEDLNVISIDVFEDIGRHYLFIATHSAVHQLLITHTDDTFIWNNINKIPVYHKYPIQTKARSL